MEEQVKAVRLVRPRLFTFELEFLISLLKEKAAMLESRRKELIIQIKELERRSDVNWVWRNQGYQAVIGTDFKKLDMQKRELINERVHVWNLMSACKGLTARFERILEGKQGRHGFESELERSILTPQAEVK
jgi:hypothetical protein